MLASAGIRQVELDCYPDPKGGLFNSSAGARLAGENGFISQQHPELNNPGWKVGNIVVSKLKGFTTAGEIGFISLQRPKPDHPGWKSTAAQFRVEV